MTRTLLDARVYEPFALCLGAVVGTWSAGKYHQGIVCGHTPEGEAVIISISLWKGCSTEPLWQFMGPQGLAEVSYPSRLHGRRVLARAISVSRRPYSLAHWNCQHFVRYAHALPVESPQASATGKAILTVSAALSLLSLAT